MWRSISTRRPGEAVGWGAVVGSSRGGGWKNIFGCLGLVDLCGDDEWVWRFFSVEMKDDETGDGPHDFLLVQMKICAWIWVSQ